MKNYLNPAPTPDGKFINIYHIFYFKALDKFIIRLEMTKNLNFFWGLINQAVPAGKNIFGSNIFTVFPRKKICSNFLLKILNWI